MQRIINDKGMIIGECKMINVKLSIEEYNRLYMFYLDEYNDNLFFKIQNNHIIFVYDPESDDAIASVDLNTPEGKILSHYIECQLRISINNDGDIFIHETCMNPDDPYIGHCYNCNVNHCQCSYSCKKGMKQKIDELDKNINDLRFINPIPNRDYHFVKELKRWKNILEGLSKDFSKNVDTDVQEICRTTELLQNQIKVLYEKWKYTEDSANGNG